MIVKRDDVGKSIRDMTRIYKPTNVGKFVKDFVRKFNVQKGYENELEQIVREELGKG